MSGRIWTDDTHGGTGVMDRTQHKPNASQKDGRQDGFVSSVRTVVGRHGGQCLTDAVERCPEA